MIIGRWRGGSWLSDIHSEQILPTYKITFLGQTSFHTRSVLNDRGQLPSISLHPRKIPRQINLKISGGIRCGMAKTSPETSHGKVYPAGSWNKCKEGAGGQPRLLATEPCCPPTAKVERQEGKMQNLKGVDIDFL